MMDDYELGSKLFGNSRAEEGKSSKSVSLLLGTAVEDSAGGVVKVVLEGDVTSDDDSNAVEIPTSPRVEEGDAVVVALSGAVGKSPVVLGNMGSGDAVYGEAARAKAAADAAEESATTAYEAAMQASADAETARDAALDAANSALAAEADAANAAQAAQEAIEDAQSASVSAEHAQESATRANASANAALSQLSEVENVVGTLNWISEHGSWSPTSDVAVDPLKIYYERTGSGTSADPYVYERVDDPQDADIASYYELTVDESVQNYIASHLAQTDYGLDMMVDGTDFRMHIGTVDGTQAMGGYVIGADGTPVAQFTSQGAVIGRPVGEMHVELTPDRLAFVDPNGNEAAYIAIDSTGFSVMYITRSVVVEDMQFGNWKWYSRANGNMSLKWMGV